MTRDIEEIVRKVLSPKRAAHSLAVAEVTDSMAPFFGLDRGETELLHRAALLHDLTKEMPLNEQIESLAKSGVSPTEDDLLADETLHALSGAIKAKEEFGLPEPFCDAIRRHTTGARVMTLYDKMLFAADYIEPNRTYENCRRQREAFWNSLSGSAALEQNVDILDRAVYNIANETVIYLVKNDKFVHPNTLWLRNALSFTLKGH